MAGRGFSPIDGYFVGGARFAGGRGAI